jgi:hypothetical protein
LNLYKHFFPVGQEQSGEIGLNYEIGAMGPYAQANTTIGRAWNLLSINGGNCGKVGTTYMGTAGNPMNLINIISAAIPRSES